VVVPALVEGHTSEGLLVMELMEGTKVTDREALVAAGIEPEEVARLLNDAYADMMFRRGVLHADPHPGNLLVEPGPRLVLLDHGLTVDLDPSLTSGLGRVVETLRTGDLEGLIPALGAVGLPVDEGTGLDALLQVVGVLLGGESVGGTDLGEFGARLGGSVGEVPPNLLLVGRAIGMLDGITRGLDPDFDALSVVARYTEGRA
jgi:predicted unusual protein kinase regulating ubiquinone biosynthesis (AarF/ABC1/UbiB family)